MERNFFQFNLGSDFRERVSARFLQTKITEIIFSINQFSSISQTSTIELSSLKLAFPWKVSEISFQFSSTTSKCLSFHLPSEDARQKSYVYFPLSIHPSYLAVPNVHSEIERESVKFLLSDFSFGKLRIKKVFRTAM